MSNPYVIIGFGLIIGGGIAAYGSEDKSTAVTGGKRHSRRNHRHSGRRHVSINI